MLNDFNPSGTAQIRREFGLEANNRRARRDFRPTVMASDDVETLG
jgi:hypothetical protein